MSAVEIYEAVVPRLAMLGYSATEADKPALEYLIAKCRVELLTNINHKEVPEGLFYTLVDMGRSSMRSWPPVGWRSRAWTSTSPPKVSPRGISRSTLPGPATGWAASRRGSAPS